MIMITSEDYVIIISSCVLFTIGVIGNTLIIIYFSSRTKHLNKMKPSLIFLFVFSYH